MRIETIKELIVFDDVQTNLCVIHQTIFFALFVITISCFLMLQKQ